MRALDDYEELCVMMYSLHVLQCRGIPVFETMVKSVGNLTRWYRETPECENFLDIIRLQLQAYVNMGRALDGENEAIRDALELLGQKADEFRPRGCFAGKRIRLTRAQVRGMIGRWRTSKRNPRTADQVAEDIIEKVSGRQNGHYFYKYYQTKSAKEPDLYELVVGEEESYFYDVSNFRFYIFDIK